MTEWRIKEMSELTKTSVRMLRHYDKIGLLKPAYRSANGYRYYTAQELARLQQIIALKYFGFDLKTIKAILQKHQNIYAHLQAQYQLIRHRYNQLQNVNDTLGHILNRISPNETPDLNDLKTLIEGFQMTKDLRNQLKQSWAGKTLNESQFEEYLLLYEQFPNEFSKRDKLIAKINNNEFGEPTGPDGEHFISVAYDIARKMKAAFAQQAKLGSSVLASMQSGQLTQLELTPDGINWVQRATFAYWIRRWEKIYDNIIANLNNDPEGQLGKNIANEWTGLINEYFSIGCQNLGVGVLLWQELARQSHEFEKQKTAPTPQELAKQFHVKLLFNPEAMSWISRALVAHST